MRILVKSFISLIAAVAIVCIQPSSSVQAQSGTKSYGTHLMQRQVSINSASQFSTSKIEQRLRNRSVRRAYNPASSLGSYRPPASSSKPFSSISRGPSVTPYLALSNSFNQVSDYYNIVRPQRQQQTANQQQQRVNQQLQRQHLANQRRLNELAAQGPYNPRGDENSAPTGHAAVFQNLGTYLNTGGYFPESSSGR